METDKNADSTSSSVWTVFICGKMHLPRLRAAARAGPVFAPGFDREAEREAGRGRQDHPADSTLQGMMWLPTTTAA